VFVPPAGRVFPSPDEPPCRRGDVCVPPASTPRGGDEKPGSEPSDSGDGGMRRRSSACWRRLRAREVGDMRYHGRMAEQSMCCTSQMAEQLIQRKKVGEEAREAGDIMAKYG